jgi:hypothetical protein
MSTWSPISQASAQGGDMEPESVIRVSGSLDKDLLLVGLGGLGLWALLAVILRRFVMRRR